MYRVIVVDDEAWSLIGIRKFLEYSKTRFQIIFETTDPVEALEKIREERPDVVFTDVRMPEISGIDLMHKVREMEIDTDFVVISGFAEFSYVQQALQEGAIDYQLKPLDMQKASEMIDKLYQKLENKRGINDLSFYISLQDGRYNNKYLLQARFKHGLYKEYRVVTVYFKSSEFDMLLFDLGEKAQYTGLRLGPRKCIFIINSNEDKSEQIYAHLFEKENVIDKAGISLPGCSADSLLMQIETSELASSDCFINPSKRISKFRKSKKGLVNQLYQKTAEALENRQFQHFKEIILGLTDYFTVNDMGITDAVLLWSKIVLYLSSHSETDDTAMDLELLSPRELSEKFVNLEAMGEYLCAQFSDPESEQAGAVNHKFHEMLHYIDNHYAEDLFLKELCNQFFINMSYCCELFRKVTDMTFSQYITNLRIKKACELLQNNGLSIAAVCERVGYNDYFYFNKVFKRNIGCTPSEYRKSRDKEK